MNLGDVEAIKRLDKGRMLESIQAFPDQCRQAFEEASSIELPSFYQQVKTVLFCGMGASALPGHIIKDLHKDKLKIPFAVNSSYTLSGWVNNQALVILSSYSGQPEETLSCADEALKRQAKIIGTTTGGNLGNFLRINNLPSYIFEPRFNFCNQARTAVGYLLTAQQLFLINLGSLDLKREEVKEAFESLPEVKSSAQAIAPRLQGKAVLVIGAEFLAGNAHLFANQLNETAKTMAAYFLIPELNHHLLDGLKFPEVNQGSLIFLFLESKLYDERNQKRFTLTKETLEKSGVQWTSYQLQSPSSINQVYEALQFTSYVSFYLAILNQVDPSANPSAVYFREKMSRGVL